jgi:hypothetical protein
MSLKYYPLTRIIPNKYTRGTEFLLPNGTSYTGRYYLTYDNKAYTGINPTLGTNELLTPVQDKLAVSTGTTLNSSNVLVNNSTQVYTAASTATGQTSIDTALVELTSYYPVPLDSDYARGYFTRYFAKNVTGPQYIIEISKLDWTKIRNGNVDTKILGYESIDMLWQLTGPLNDTRISQYQIQGGVYDTNKRVTEAKQKVFRGIVEFIGGNYTQFARITPVLVATSGSI